METTVASWLQEPGPWIGVLGQVLWRVALAIVIAAGARIASGLAIRLFDRLRASPLRPAQREVLGPFFRGFIRYAIYTVAALLILNKSLGLSTASLITATGILGLAVSFGLQGFVRDVVTGISLLMEDAFAPGDLVEIAGQTGVVEEIGLRSTRLRDAQGELRVIPNGNIGPVVNHSKRRIAVITFFTPAGGGALASGDTAAGGGEATPDGREPAELVRALEGALRGLLEELWRARALAARLVGVQWAPLTGAGLALVTVRVSLEDLHQRVLVEPVLLPLVRSVVARLGLEAHEGRLSVRFEGNGATNGQP